MWTGAFLQDPPWAETRVSPRGCLGPDGTATVTKSQEPCHLHTVQSPWEPPPGPHFLCAGRPYLREEAVWLELLGGDAFFEDA